jgi:hypothetical protein
MFKDPGFQTAVNKFDKGLADYGSLQAWLEHRKSTEPNFAVDQQRYNSGPEFLLINKKREQANV